jgi:hypothetical protein
VPSVADVVAVRERTDLVLPKTSDTACADRIQEEIGSLELFPAKSVPFDHASRWLPDVKYGERLA